jgi:hypothetical protein
MGELSRELPAWKQSNGGLTNRFADDLPRDLSGFLGEGISAQIFFGSFLASLTTSRQNEANSKMSVRPSSRLNDFGFFSASREGRPGISSAALSPIPAQCRGHK